jgi:hypothetical protein
MGLANARTQVAALHDSLGESLRVLIDRDKLLDEILITLSQDSNQRCVPDVLRATVDRWCSRVGVSVVWKEPFNPPVDEIVEDPDPIDSPE